MSDNDRQDEKCRYAEETGALWCQGQPRGALQVICHNGERKYPNVPPMDGARVYSREVDDATIVKSDYCNIRHCVNYESVQDAKQDRR